MINTHLLAEFLGGQTEGFSYLIRREYNLQTLVQIGQKVRGEDLTHSTECLLLL